MNICLCNPPPPTKSATGINDNSDKCLAIITTNIKIVYLPTKFVDNI